MTQLNWMQMRLVGCAVNGFFTYLELFLSGGVVTWVDTVWLDGEAAVVASRTFLVGALRLVG